MFSASSKLSRTAKFWSAVVAIVALAALAFPTTSYAARPLLGPVEDGMLQIHVEKYPMPSFPSSSLVELKDIASPYYAEVTTDGNGNASIAIPAGTYLVKITTPQYETWHGRVKTGPSMFTNLDVRVMSTYNRGEATIDVRSAKLGSPLADANVTMRDESGYIVESGVTGADGLLIASAPAGKYMVNVEADGYQSQKLAIEVMAGQKTTWQVDMLPTGGGFTTEGDEKGTLELTTLDSETQAPVASAWVQIAYMDGRAAFTGQTDLKGGVKAVLSAGDYTVNISAYGYFAYSSEVKMEAGTAIFANVMLVAESSDPTPVPEPGTFTLNVIDEHKLAVADANVTVWSADKVVYEGVTSLTGVVSTELAPGAYTFTVQAPSYETYWGDVEIISEMLDEQTVVLTGTGPGK